MNMEKLAETPPWEWPEDAEEILSEVLRDRSADARQRLLAASLAGELVVVNEELVDILLSIVADGGQTPELRSEAAIAFGATLEQCDVEGFDEDGDTPISEATFERIVEQLRSLYHHAEVPKLVRRRVLEAAVRAPRDWQTAAVRAAHASGDEEWRLTAVFSMRWVSGFDAQILEALESDDEEIREHAIEAAGNWQIAAAWDPIAELATSAEAPKDVRLAAIEAAACIRPHAVAELIEHLVDDPDEDVAASAEEAIMLAEALADEPLDD